ncbi:hypothetical protein SISSUDRAFT_1041555 [Sistotremastrum suecicum HHB10207 ss-3]|uniref:Uncharacterized protein n=1 Tax=Sistotremastrum suecicum HHB10207 ss-3 TaxID=1314776 RepID=A0A166H2U7_9AGAM|nr:hypothetical protein SISSUDRAFT_1041555 [Sistotremastrum suecicum HHB10207 ss-3]
MPPSATSIRPIVTLSASTVTTGGSGMILSARKSFRSLNVEKQSLAGAACISCLKIVSPVPPISLRIFVVSGKGKGPGTGTGTVTGMGMEMETGVETGGSSGLRN